MAECITCFQTEKSRRTNGTIHYHNQKDVVAVLCGSCTQKIMMVAAKIPWNEKLRDVIRPKIHGYRRMN